MAGNQLYCDEGPGSVFRGFALLHSVTPGWESRLQLNQRQINSDGSRESVNHETRSLCTQISGSKGCYEALEIGFCSIYSFH